MSRYLCTLDVKWDECGSHYPCFWGMCLTFTYDHYITEQNTFCELSLFLFQIYFKGKNKYPEKNNPFNYCYFPDFFSSLGAL